MPHSGTGCLRPGRSPQIAFQAVTRGGVIDSSGHFASQGLSGGEKHQREGRCPLQPSAPAFRALAAVSNHGTIFPGDRLLCNVTFTQPSRNLNTLPLNIIDRKLVFVPSRQRGGKAVLSQMPSPHRFCSWVRPDRVAGHTRAEEGGPSTRISRVGRQSEE